MRSESIKRYVMPFFGMSLFWLYFRHQSFFGLLYPLRAFEESLAASPLYLILLSVLLVLCGLAIAFRRRIEGVLYAKRLVFVFLGAVGSVGALAGIASIEGWLGAWAAWVSIPCVALGFLSGYFAWAAYFSDRFCPEDIVVLAASYLASLLFFSHYFSEIFLAVAPLGSSLCWLFSCSLTRTPSESKMSSLKNVTLYAGLFIAFILVGSVMRGIVDSSGANVDAGFSFRWPLSLVVSAIMLLACLWYARSCRAAGDSGDGNEAGLTRSIESMTLIGWMMLSLMFFGAVFVGFVVGSYDASGHAAVVARSTLDFLLWVVLCNLVHEKRLSPVLVFAACSVLTNIISWGLSYVAIPRVLSIETASRVSVSDMLVLIAIFSLLAFIILVFGVVALKKQTLGIHKKTGVALEVALPSMTEEMAEQYRLTSREAEVAGLFAQGHSMKKVASMLFISTSTAQSHIKSAYRKLGVHSKDELIESISAWRNT